MRHILILSIFFSLFFLPVSNNYAQIPSNKAAQANSAITTSDPNISLDELETILIPMTSDELFVEADGWMALLKDTAERISRQQLEIKRKNRLIEKKGDAVETSKNERIEQQTEKELEKEKEKKAEILDDMNTLQNQKTSRIDHLNVVLKAITEKIGLGEKGKEPEKVMPYRRYINAVGGVKVDVSDTYAVWVNIVGWMTSSEGGVRWLVNALKFLIIVVIFWGLSKVVSKAAGKALELSLSDSIILNNFIISSSRRLTFFIGLLVGLSALEVNVGPVIAIIGAAGFVVAFALQGTLSNFASGLMIMFYRPFDVGDMINVSGEYGIVQSMNLVSTSVMTFDNKLMVVPNNDIWGNTITNATKSTERRIDMVFGIGYSDNIEQAKQVLDKILADHPKVMSEPAPVVRLHELGDSSVNFICRPWAKTADYWDVYWDVTKQVKERFDAEGISIPFPQRDIHIYNENV